MRRLTAVLALTALTACAPARGRPLLHDRGVDRRTGPGISAPLLVEPDDGVRPLVSLINRTQRSIFVETYILSDSRVTHALERAAAQGVAVYVVLEHHPYGLAGQPARIEEALRAAGIYVRWARPDVALTHAKFLVLDDHTAVVGTANLSRAAFSRNREFLVILRGRRDVHAVSNLFRADWNRIPATLGDADLAVSPSNARHKLVALVASARRSIAVYGEEMADPAVERLLGRTARRHVVVRVLLPPDANRPDVRRLRRAGVDVRGLTAPYIHAKMVLVDGREALVGSINISTQSLDRNREVSVLLRGRAVGILQATFQRDWSRAH